MKRMPALTWLTIALFCSAISLPSCKRGEVAEGVQVRVAVREGLEADGIRQLAAEWERRRGVKVSVQTLGRGNYEADVTNDLMSRAPKYDVVFFPGTLVAEMVNRQALAPIDNWSPSQDPDLLSYSAVNGRVYGLPCDVSTFFMFYRDDVVRKPPGTWDELLATTPKYTRRANARVPTEFGLAFAGKAGEELPKIFYPIMWSYGGFIIEGDKVGIDSPGSIEAAGLLKKLVTSGATPPDIQTWEVTKIFDELQRGSVAISVPQWNALYPLIQGGTSSVRQRTKIAQLPGVRQKDGQIKRANFRHTWVLVKSGMGKNRDLANEFILFATSKDGALLYAKTARGNPARASVLSDIEMQKSRPEFPLLLESLKISKAEPEVAFYASMHRAMNEALSSILAGTSPPAKAMKEAADKIRMMRQR
jgi:ABC-type glycerol-3-phosphate transport system substrate-binding protein